MNSPPARPERRLAGWTPAVGAVVVLLSVALAPSADAARWTWSGSGTLHYKKLFRTPGGEALVKEGAIAEWNIKANVEVSERLSVTARLCTSCHGLTVDQAYAEIRYKPQLNLEVGRINVPFGDFYLRHDPASDAFLSKPLPYAMGHMLRYQQTRFNLGVLPMPYVDQGVSLFGNVWIRESLQIWYGLYGVNGFRSGFPRDFTFKDQVSDAGFNDNNDDVSWGGRIAVAQGPLAGGASYLRGAYDPAGDYDYEAWGIDGSAFVFGLKLRAEYLERETDVVEGSVRAVLRKKGFFAQLEAPVHRYLALVGRFDGLLREGPPLGTDNDGSSGIVRWTLGANVTPAMDHGFRLQYERWRFTDFRDENVIHVGMVMTY